MGSATPTSGQNTPFSPCATPPPECEHCSRIDDIELKLQSWALVTACTSPHSSNGAIRFFSKKFTTNTHANTARGGRSTWRILFSFGTMEGSNAKAYIALLPSPFPTFLAARYAH